MEYYAGEKDIQAMDEMVQLAQQLIRRVISAKACAQETTALPGGSARDASQADYDSHLGWVRKLAEELHTAATNLP